MNPTLADFKLPRRARRTLEALVPIVCPSDVEELGLAPRLVDEAERMLRAFPAYLRVGLSVGLAAFDLGARGFVKQPREAQERYFHAWWASPLMPARQIAKAAKALLVMAYYEEPIVKARMAYHPERWIADVAKARFNRFAAEIRAEEAHVIAPDPLRAPEEKRHVRKA